MMKAYRFSNSDQAPSRDLAWVAIETSRDNRVTWSPVLPMARFSLRRLLKYLDGPRGSKLERMARHERGACPQRPVTSEKRSQTPQPAGRPKGCAAFSP